MVGSQPVRVENGIQTPHTRLGSWRALCLAFPHVTHLDGAKIQQASWRWCIFTRQHWRELTNDRCMLIALPLSTFQYYLRPFSTLNTQMPTAWKPDVSRTEKRAKLLSRPIRALKFMA